MQSETSIGWQDYLAVVLRRRWFFGVPCVVIVIAAMVIGLFLPKIYRAETVMLVEEPSVMNPLMQGMAFSTPVRQRLRIVREELLGWTSLSRLVHELNFDKYAKSPLAFEKLIKRLQRDIQVRTRGGNLIVIAYEDEDPKLTQKLVNTITNIYLERNVESQSAEAGTAISFIESEMAVYKDKLEDSERALREFRELYAMQMPVATALNDQIVDLEVLMAQLLVENTKAHPTVVQTKRRITELKAKRNQEIRRVIAQALVKGADPAIYQDLAQALDEPVTDGNTEAPTVRAAREAYHAWIDRLDNSAVAPNEAQSPQIQVVTAGQGQEDGQPLQVIGAGTPLLSLAPRQQQELARLTRDYQVHSATYQHMKTRLERAKVTQRLGESDEGTKFKILEPARLPLKPVRPNMLKIFVFSLLLGAFVGAGIAFIVEYLDQSFQAAEDVEAALGLPVLGSVSTIVTEGDIRTQRRQRRGWMTLKNQIQGLKTYIFKPVWVLVDRTLLRWGL